VHLGDDVIPHRFLVVAEGNTFELVAFLLAPTPRRLMVMGYCLSIGAHTSFISTPFR
jgi:hypothetical protein